MVLSYAREVPSLTGRLRQAVLVPATQEPSVRYWSICLELFLVCEVGYITFGYLHKLFLEERPCD